MNQAQLNEIRCMVDEVISSSSKKDAADSIRKLKFKASAIKGGIDPYLSGKLSEVINYATTAAGQSSDKERYISSVNDCWYVFENGFDL